MSHEGAYVARNSAAPAPGQGNGNSSNAHDGTLSGNVNNDFGRTTQYSSQDGFNGSNHQQTATGGAAPPHWSHQTSPYGAAAAYSANQFAGPPATAAQHHGYPSSAASPYGLSVGGGPYQSHTSPYSFSVQQQQQQHPHHRAGPYPSYTNHEAGLPASNGAPAFSQHAPNASTGAHGSASGNMGTTTSYHSPAIAGMMSGMAPHSSAASGHQSGGYPSHYNGSALPPGGPMPSSVPQPQAMSAPGYPSAPQYSTQLPLAGRHRVTTTLWEDEGTLCFQVDARGVCVARRHDNSMINGTKLLNVCGMSRGKRDGILKNEKERIVVKVGAMHLKGVWITFQRGKQLAEQNGISDVLYPLFEPNIQSFLYHPDNYPRTAAVMAAAQERQAARKSSGASGPGPASGIDLGGPPTNSLIGSASHDGDYSGGQGGWNPMHHAQQHHYRHPVANGNSYVSSAPVTAVHSPAHHTHSGYTTPGAAMMQSHNSQQSGTPLSNHSGLVRTSLGSNNGSVQNANDRRHSMPLEMGTNPMDHPGRIDNPYSLSSNHSSMDNGLTSSSSSSTTSNGPSTAATLQSLPGIGSVGQRRTLSSTSYKRGYDDDEGANGSAGPHGGPSYEGGPPSGAGNGDFYGSGERLYKRPRESGIGRISGPSSLGGLVKHEVGPGGGGHAGEDQQTYDSSAEYGAPAHGEKRGSGATA